MLHIKVSRKEGLQLSAQEAMRGLNALSAEGSLILSQNEIEDITSKVVELDISGKLTTTNLLDLLKPAIASGRVVIERLNACFDLSLGENLVSKERPFRNEPYQGSEEITGERSQLNRGLFGGQMWGSLTLPMQTYQCQRGSVMQIADDTELEIEGFLPEEQTEAAGFAEVFFKLRFPEEKSLHQQFSDGSSPAAATIVELFTYEPSFNDFLEVRTSLYVPTNSMDRSDFFILVNNTWAREPEKHQYQAEAVFSFTNVERDSLSLTMRCVPGFEVAELVC